MRNFSLATKRCKVFSFYLFVDSQTVGCVFCLPESLFQHFLTVEDIDVAVVHGFHLTTIEVIDLAVLSGSSFGLTDTSLCFLVDNEGICLDCLQVVRAVEQLQPALSIGSAELADGSERALVSCCGCNNGVSRVFGSRAYLVFVKRDGLPIDGYCRLVYIVDEADVVDVEAVSAAFSRVCICGDRYKNGFSVYVIVRIDKWCSYSLPNKAFRFYLCVFSSCNNVVISFTCFLWVLIICTVGDSCADCSIRMLGNGCLLFKLYPNSDGVGRAVHEYIEWIAIAILVS